MANSNTFFRQPFWGLRDNNDGKVLWQHQWLTCNVLRFRVWKAEQAQQQKLPITGLPLKKKCSAPPPKLQRWEKPHLCVLPQQKQSLLSSQSLTLILSWGMRGKWGSRLKGRWHVIRTIVIKCLIRLSHPLPTGFSKQVLAGNVGPEGLDQFSW